MHEESPDPERSLCSQESDTQVFSNSFKGYIIAKTLADPGTNIITRAFLPGYHLLLTFEIFSACDTNNQDP
uniref:AlNc14C76G5097 protein n=1 Tax=Albugo laibachii Nc14 TaxID=890382 RepID=F0WEP7_9STRA|nr:AlNc14C76G5097 [Albugo laibachii Nc14]|eukprot:CCA19679.1 AlNc14C76G5097 [Albugo laibachii Nc14]